MATGAKTRKMIYELPLEGLTRTMRRNVRDLLLLIANYTKGGDPTIARSAMAKALDRHVSTVDRAIAAAEALGLLVVEENIGAKGQRSNRYYLTLEGAETPEVPPMQNEEGPSSKWIPPLCKKKRGPMQNGEAYKRITISSSLSPSSSPPPLPPTPIPNPSSLGNPNIDTPPPAGVRCRVWESALTELEACGLSSARSALQIVRERRHLNPQGVSEIIAHYRAHKGAWQPGGLYQRLVNGTKDQRPDEGWPPMSIAYQRSQRSRAIEAQNRFSQEETRRRQAEDRKRLEVIKRERAEYELRRKRYLEPFLKLPKHEQKPIIDEVIGQNRFLRERYERSGIGAIEREIVGYLERKEIRSSS